MTALVAKKFVLTLNCPYSEDSLQSECPDCLLMALSLHQDCPYIKCAYKDTLLYFGVNSHKGVWARQVVRDDGSLLACALNATCAALVDAGVLLYNLFGMYSHHQYVAFVITLCRPSSCGRSCLTSGCQWLQYAEQSSKLLWHSAEALLLTSTVFCHAASVTCSLDRHTGSLRLDPTTTEEQVTH